MFKRFFSWIRQVMSRMVTYKSIDEVVGSHVISDEMSNAIDNWMEMYQGRAPWLEKDRKSLKLPSTIASEIARLVTLEMQMNVSGDGDRAKFIEETLKPVLKGIRIYTEYACAGGGLAFKPSVINGKVEVEFVQANHFLPLSFDSSSRITGAAFMEHEALNNMYYTRVEKHELKGELLTITNIAYRSYSDDSIGSECALSEYPDWANIEPVVTVAKPSGNLYSYFKIPLGNTIDPLSPLGVSVYSDAVDLIQDADEQYQRLMWEFEGGEMAIDASEDAFKIVKGEPIVPVGKERLFRTNKLDAATGSGELMKPWTPTLRDQSFIAGLQEILVKIEDKVGLSRGTLSNKYVDARTAEEIKQTKQRSYSTVSDIQKALQTALEELAEAVNQLATLYELNGDGKYELSFKWDDSIVTDANTEREVDRQDVRDGFMSKWEYRKKWYGEDEKTAKKAIADMAAEAEPDDDELIGFSKPKAKAEEEPEEGEEK